jgi:radical SAM superfamily enzyme YgiQ (UPF0313 family)
MTPSIILINPWIYDFAAFDLWSKPLGLLYIAGFLKKIGFNVHLIDCLDIYNTDMKPGQAIYPAIRRTYGTGKYWRQRIPLPQILKHTKRAYSRYGITKQSFIKELQTIKTPSAILVTSLMTYWYPGVREAIKLAKEVHPGVPVILGGVYARICSQHAAQFSGADYIAHEVTLQGLNSLLDIMDRFGIPLPGEIPNKTDLVLPAFDLLGKIDYVCILTSTGCPYRCPYCASSILYPGFSRRDPKDVVDEIEYWHRCGVMDFAFYDDALLVDSDRHIGPILEGVLSRDMNARFHTPNALHIREISPHIAKLLHVSGFRTIRLGLETSDLAWHDTTDKKVSEGEFESAVHNLKEAGFKKRDIGTYILMGLPGQSVKSAEDSIRFVNDVGAVAYLAEYSPIPHTVLWEKAIESSSYDIANEPLFHNNTLLACWDEDKRQEVVALRKLAREMRQ